MVWARFMDMHSGGGQKEDFDYLLIEAPEAEAKVIFYNRFGHNPERVTCTCCGEDYSVDEHPSIQEATSYDRRCRWAEDGRYTYEEARRKPEGFKEGRYLEPEEDVPEGMYVKDYSWLDKDSVPLNVFLANPAGYGYQIVPESEILPAERVGDVPEQGYVWKD